MAARSHEERLDRLEQVVGILAEDQLSLQKLIGELATETRRGFDRVAAQFQEIGKSMAETAKHMAETDERLRQTDERLRQTDERMRHRSSELDERVDKLVIAIGEFIRNTNAPRA